MTPRARFAALTGAAGGARVALERSLGWSRQLRLTPLHPVAYILMKTLVALVMGALAIAAAPASSIPIPFSPATTSSLAALSRARRTIHGVPKEAASTTTRITLKRTRSTSRRSSTSFWFF